MADLREQLRRIEAAEPPDLWAGIESRATEGRPRMDTSFASVVAFRGRRSEQRRRVAAGLLAAAVFALTIVVAWRAFRDAPIERIPTGSELPAGWVRCTNSTLGYSIGYPGTWHTTDVLIGEQDPSNACQWFSRAPFGPQGNVVSEGWGYPLEVGIRGPFDQQLARVQDPEVARILVQEELVVDGHRAVRVEYETLVDLIADTGLHYEYLVELDPETTLIVHTTATRSVQGVYEENRRIVDQAVDTLRFEAPISGAVPHRGISFLVVRPPDKPGCFLCHRPTFDPDKREVPWARAVAGGVQVLVCPDCQHDRADWAESLDRCEACGSTRLSVTLGEVVCRACGHTARAGA